MSRDYEDANLKEAYKEPKAYQGQANQQECCGGQANAAGPSPEYVIDQIFTYHSPTYLTLPKFQAIREAGKYFAKVILQNVPIGQDRLNAILKVREAVMTANAGISLDGFQL